MTAHSPLELRVWQAVARAENLDDALPELARCVARELPLTTLAIIAFEGGPIPVCRLAQVAEDCVEPADRIVLPAESAGPLLEWFAARNPRARVLSTLLPDPLAGARHRVACALPCAEPELPALLVLTFSGRCRPESATEALVAALPPLVGRHRRRAQVSQVAAAAVAEREALLAKLGRGSLEPQVVGAQRGLKEVMRQVSLVGPTDVPVLLLGETGSGKEVVARQVHQVSSREGGPFIRVNCGAIPPELVDSELFGHEKGSFTGAVGRRLGWFERAHQGTLFLDEVGELPPAAQVRLLRVLQDGRFTRVGGQAEVAVDVRLVAATNAPLGTLVAQGRFRSDLWYRINVIPIHIPPLRSRPEDMPALAAHFARRAARRFGLPPILPTREQLDLLLGYHWPGNIRELSAVIDRAALLGNGKSLEIGLALGGQEGPGPEAQTPVTLDEAMRTHIEAALRRVRGQIEGREGVARLLDVNPHTLRARMRRLGITWQDFRVGSGDDETPQE